MWGAVWVCVCVCALSCSVMFDSLQLHGLQPARLLCLWNSPGQNTGVGSHVLLQGIFPTQGSNLGLLHCRQILHHLNHQGCSPSLYVSAKFFCLRYKCGYATHLLKTHKEFHSIQNVLQTRIPMCHIRPFTVWSCPSSVFMLCSSLTTFCS